MDQHHEHTHRQEEEEQTIDLTVLFRDFIRGIGKFWWLLVVLALLGGLISYFRASGTYYPTVAGPAANIIFITTALQRISLL